MVITVSCPACQTSFPVDPNKIPEAGVKVRCSRCAHVFRVERPTGEPEVAALPSLPDLTPAPEPTPAPASDPEAVPDAPEDWTIERDAPEQAAAAEEPTGEPAPEAVPDSSAALPDWAVEEAANEGLASDEEDGPLPGREDVALDAQIDDWAAEPVPGPDEAGPTEPEIEDPLPEPVSEQSAREAETAAPTEDEPVKGFSFGKRDPTDKARRLARVLVSDMVMYNAERHQAALERGTLEQDFEDEIAKSWKEYVDQLGTEVAEGEGRGFWTQALNDILAKGRALF